MSKKRDYKPLDDLLELSKTVKIGNDLHDIFPVSYSSIYKLLSSYLFIKNREEFFINIMLLSNPVRRFGGDFSLFNLTTEQNLRNILFPMPSWDILTKERRFIDDSKLRNSAFLSSKWEGGDLKFLSFHDLLIYKILKKSNAKAYCVEIDKEVKAIITSGKVTIMNCSSSEIEIIKSVTNKRKSESLSLEYFDELVKSFILIAEKKEGHLIINDDLSFLFREIKLDQGEFLTASSAWFYEYWMENNEDFPEEMIIDDMQLFSDRIGLIIDNEKIQKLLIELYKNLVSLRICNFSNPNIEEDLEIELKIKESYNHLVSTIESNQDLISDFFKDSEELKAYLTIKNKESLLRNLDSMLRFFKIKNYADKFFDKNLIYNHKISAFTEEDGVFYKIVGLGDRIEEKNKEQKNGVEFFSNKKATDKAKAFFDEGKLSHFTIFDHLTNTKKIIAEERQIYVDSREVLNLLMKDFLGKEYFKFQLPQHSDLENLIDIFSKKIYEHFGVICSSIKIESTALEDRLIEFTGKRKIEGQKYTIIDNANDMAELGLKDPQRFEALINGIDEEGLINKGNVEVSGKFQRFRLELTIDGWKKFDEICDRNLKLKEVEEPAKDLQESKPKDDEIALELDCIEEDLNHSIVKIFDYRSGKKTELSKFKGKKFKKNSQHGNFIISLCKKIADKEFLKIKPSESGLLRSTKGAKRASQMPSALGFREEDKELKSLFFDGNMSNQCVVFYKKITKKRLEEKGLSNKI